jgi:hypothetical protein
MLAVLIPALQKLVTLAEGLYARLLLMLMLFHIGDTSNTWAVTEQPERLLRAEYAVGRD